MQESEKKASDGGKISTVTVCDSLSSILPRLYLGPSLLLLSRFFFRTLSLSHIGINRRCTNRQYRHAMRFLESAHAGIWAYHNPRLDNCAGQTRRGAIDRQPLIHLEGRQTVCESRIIIILITNMCLVPGLVRCLSRCSAGKASLSGAACHAGNM
jgi:hypothetical protein